MKKLLHKSCQWIMMLIATLIGAATAMADTTTFNVVNVQPTSAITQGPITLTPGNGWMVYSTNGWYAVDNTAPFTLSCADGYNIESVKVYQSWSGFGKSTFSASVTGDTSGSVDAYYQWTGKGTTITFTSNPNYTVLFDRIEVAYSSAAPVVQPNFPVEGQAYQLKHNGRGTFLTVVENDTKCAVLSDTQQALYFTWDQDHAGFTIKNEAGLYVGKATNDWNMSSSNPEYWAVQEADGGYVLKRTDAAKYLNFDSGNEAFRDKISGAVFTIEPYQAPSAEQPSFPAEGVTYQLQLVDNYATNYLNLQKDKTKAALLGAAPQGFTFTWDADNKGFIVQNTDGLYLGQPEAITVSGIGSQTPEYWNVVQNGNSYYLKCSKGYLGFSSYNTGATATSNNANAEDSFIFTEYVAPDLTPFTIPSSFIRESTTEMQMGDQIYEQLAFVITANSDYGVEAFKLYPNGKAITFSVDGQSTSATLTCTQSGYCSITGMYPEISGEGNHNIVFPEGTFEAANGKVNTAFEYIYTIVAPGAVEYTVGIYGEWSQDGTLNAAPDGAYIVFKNAPGTPYYTGDKYVSEYVPSAADFACGIPYWEIDEQHSVFSEYGKSITIYLKRIPYQYYVTIEGNDNAGVKVNGVRYANGETVETYELLHRTDVTFLTYKGYNLITADLQDPKDGKGGVIYAGYEAIQYAKATFDHANPAVGEISLDNSEGIHYLTLYFKEDLTDSQSFDGIPAGVTMTDEKGTTYTLSNFGGQAASERMSSCINIATEKLISAPGTYTLHIPAGIFYFGEKEDMVNDELDLVWTITARQHYDLDNSAVQTLGERKDPTNEWSGLKNLSGFEITLPAEFDAFMQGYYKLYIAPEGGMYGEEINVEDLTEASGYSMALVQGTNTIRVSFDQTLAPAEPTYYSYIIPAGAFRTTDGLTNKQINLSASVDPTVYFDLVVTYPAAGNAQAPVDHMVIELPEGLQVSNVDGTSINFNSYNATVEKFEQNGRELTITFADHAAQAGDEASYYIPRSVITGTALTPDATAAVRMANSTTQQYNIPVTAAPVEYLVEFAGWPFDTHAPQVTYDGDVYYGDKHIVATDLTVEDLTATDADGYSYVITIDQPGYVQSHGFGRVLVTYTAKAYAAVSSVSPAAGSEISLDANPDGLGSITITMELENENVTGWDASVFAGEGNPVPAGVQLLDPNGDEVTINDSYGFCMWADSKDIYVNHASCKTPGTYTLIIPAGLNTIGGKENPRMEYTWTVKAATTFEFAYNAATALGDRNNDGVQLSLTGFTVALPENLSDISTEGPGPVDLYITVSTGDEMSEEPAEPTLVSSTYSITDGVVTFTFPEAYTEKGRVSVTLNANNISINGLSNKAFSTSFYVDPNPVQYFELASATAETKYTAFNEITEYSVTSSSDLWSGIVLDITAEMLANKTITVSYYTQEEGTVEKTATVESVSEANSVVTFQFTDPVTIPFDTWYSVIFPAGFITFDVDNIQNSTARFNNHKLVESYVYDVVYDETVPEGASLLQNGITIPVSKESFGGPVQVESADFTATAVLGMKPVITIVQPTREAPVGTITLSYETIEPVPFNGQFTLNGTPSSLGNDRLSSITSITVPAPEGHTFASAEDCVLLFKGNIDSDYVTYESEATISEDGSEVTITLQPAYSTPGFGNQIALADGSLFLENGAEYIGFNCSFTLFPEYAFDIDHTDPADRAAIYNGDLDHIDVYLPAGLNVGYNTDFGIEVVGTDYVESFQPSYISNFGDFYRIQLPSSMDLPYGRITVTIPSDVFYYYDYENNDRYVTNAPYTLWIDNFSALQLVTEPAAGTVVGLDAIRVKGERGTLWTADTDAEALAQHITFGTWEGPVAVTTAIENGVLVVTPVETLAEGNYTLSIDGLAGFLESADVAASVNAPARFEFNVVGSTFAFQDAQPYDGQIISDIHELETINLRFSTWTVGNVSVSEAAGNEPILVTLIDGEGIERTVIETYPEVGENDYGTPVAQLVGTMQGFTCFETPDGKYNVSLTIPAGMFISDNGRTNEEMTLHYIYDSNKYFAVEPNFEKNDYITGPVKTFTLTASEGATFTDIAPDKVADPENGVDRPTVFNNSGYVTYAIPTISADGKSVTLTLAEPLKTADQYYLVVPEGLFIGTVTDENDRPATAINRSIGAWQQIFYVDAPVYEYAIINGGTTEYLSGDVLDESAVYSVFFPIAQGVDSGDASGVTLTDAEGNNIEISGAWRLWYEAHGAGINVQFNGSLTEEGTYHVHIPAGSFKDDNGADIAAIDFEFVISKFYNVYATDEDKTFTVLEYIDVDSQALLEDNYSVDPTKLCINTHEYDSNGQFIYAPVAVSKYEVVTVDPGVPAIRFYLETPITVANYYGFKFKAGLIYGEGFKTREMNATLQVDPYPNDISRDGKEDVDDVNAIADIILQTEDSWKYDDDKADQNGDHEVTIGDLVKYIEKLRETPVDETDPSQEAQ